MARGINKAIIVGTMGDEPTCRQTNSGISVANISIVTNEIKRNIDTGKNTEIAEWHHIVLWGKLAEIAKGYLHKGSQVYIEGRMRTRGYLDKQNQKHYVTEIIAEQMEMLGTRCSQSNQNTFIEPDFGPQQNEKLIKNKVNEAQIQKPRE